MVTASDLHEGNTPGAGHSDVGDMLEIAQRPPILLLGFQRSGTTLLRVMLNAHPQIGIPHDSGPLWPSYWRECGNLSELSEIQSQQALRRLLKEKRIESWDAKLPEEMLLVAPVPRTMAEIMRRVHGAYAFLHGKRYWGDKNTGYVTELAALSEMFPDGRFIHLIRDGRDCAVSHRSRTYVYGYENVLRTAMEWRDQVSMGRKMGRRLPGARYMTIHYEDLVSEPKSVLQNVCRYLGVEFSSSMLNYFGQVERSIPEEKRNLWPLIGRPPQKSNVGKWRRELSSADIAIFERVAGDLLRELGYDLVLGPTRRGVVKELWYRVHTPIHWRLRRIGRLLLSVRNRN